MNYISSEKLAAVSNNFTAMHAKKKHVWVAGHLDRSWLRSWVEFESILGWKDKNIPHKSLIETYSYGHQWGVPVEKHDQREGICMVAHERLGGEQLGFVPGRRSFYSCNPRSPSIPLREHHKLIWKKRSSPVHPFKRITHQVRSRFIAVSSERSSIATWYNRVG